MRDVYTRIKQYYRESITVGFTLIALFYIVFLKPPHTFIPHSVVTVEEGQTLREIVTEFEKANIVRSGITLQNFVILYGGERKVVAGDYFFDKPVNVLRVAKRLTQGQYGLEPLRLTIPEGTNIFELASLCSARFTRCSHDHFLKEAVDLEGYLFPDTYLLLPNATGGTMIKVMQDTFEEKIKMLEEKIAAFGKPLEEVIIMASILEEEARKKDTRQMIADILWRRLELEMPLQVDVTFQYINGKNSYQLTLNDLATSSPYNTYKNKGLPPGPITNPGLEAIEAAITPTTNDYLYFLSDRAGNMYYAKTFDEHVENKHKYLNQY